MAKKKATRLKSSKTKRKQRTFLSLFILAALAITVGLPLALKFNSSSTPSQKVAAAISTSVNITSLTTSQSYNAIGGIVSCESPNFISTYKVSCWNKSEVTRNVLDTNPDYAGCVTIEKIAQDANSYCKTQAPLKTPTPTGTKVGFKSPSPCKVLSAGDINLDGYVTTADTNLTTQFVAGTLKPTSSQLLRADLNGNGSLSSADVALNKAYALGQIKTFPVCGSPTPTQTPFKPTNPWGATPTGYNPWITPTPAPTKTSCPAYGSSYSTYCSGNTLREKYSNGSCGTTDNLVRNCSNGCTKVTSTDARCN